jgi:hypothetical protein
MRIIAALAIPAGLLRVGGCFAFGQGLIVGIRLNLPVT